MPSVDELLNMAEVAEATLTETNDVIEIDADTRTMIIPDTERIFGVMSDEKGERKYFRCKRFVGNGIDLSKLDLRVIYQNASGLESGRDKYIVTDLATDGEDYVTFSWELSRKVTAYKGIISFIVCAIKIGTDGIITNEWNTTLANGVVLDGLEVSGTQEQEKEAYDYYKQLEAELEKKAQEVIGTIPSDYTQTLKDVSNLKGEVTDGRTDVDGEVHKNIGDAMRGQARKLRENLVVRQKEQPTDPNNNVWISDEDDEVEVPDMGEFNSLKEDVDNIQSIVYAKNIDEMVVNSKITTTDINFVGNDFTNTDMFGGIGGFQTHHKYKMVLIPSKEVYASIKVLDGINGSYIVNLLSTTYVAKDKSIVVDIPDTITWNSNIRICLLASDTYITNGKIYLYDITELPKGVIENTDFTTCTNPLHIEVLAISNENAKSIVNYDNWYKGKKLSTLGDSITEQNLWQSFVKDKVPFSSIVNKGIGGTRISGNNENAMWRDIRINALPLDTDVLTIMGGTNDSAASVEIGDLSITNHDTNTFVGAYNVLISKVLYKFYNLSSGKYTDIDYSGLTKSDTFKDIIIYIMTPPFNANTQYSGENSVRLKAIADATKNISKMWGIPCIDIYYNSDINTENVNVLLQDGIHPNKLGAKKIASVVVNGMKSYEPIN